MSDSSSTMELNSLYFTIQEELDFEQWYNDGYSLVNERYEALVKINHPEHFRPGNDNLHLS